MGKIFICTGKKEIADTLISKLRSLGCQVNRASSIAEINSQSLPTDIALKIDTNSSKKGIIFYIANNIDRKKHAELILLLLGDKAAKIGMEKTEPDTKTERGFLEFCRQVNIPSLEIKLPLYLEKKQEIATAIIEGIIAWSREVSGVEPTEKQEEVKIISTPKYPKIDLKLNYRDYSEPGILVNGNPCIPVDLIDRLEIYSIASPCIEYKGIVYAQAIGLREHNLSVLWHNPSRTLFICSILGFDRNSIDFIMGYGNTSIEQLTNFLKENNSESQIDFVEVAKTYVEEAGKEGVNYDIAFSQMCLETDFLQSLKNERNFANLGNIGGEEYACFADLHVGIRAHIQHLKAYASREPLLEKVVDPRFHLVARGIAPRVSKLGRRWSACDRYGDKIMAILRRLYESANLM